MRTTEVYSWGKWDGGRLIWRRVEAKEEVASDFRGQQPETANHEWRWRDDRTAHSFLIRRTVRNGTNITKGEVLKRPRSVIESEEFGSEDIMFVYTVARRRSTRESGITVETEARPKVVMLKVLQFQRLSISRGLMLRMLNNNTLQPTTKISFFH